MNVTSADVGKYLFSVNPAPEAAVVKDKIVRLDEVNESSITVSIIEQNLSKERTEVLPSSLMDKWYNISDLVFSASLAIAPELSDYSYLNDTASEYRNFVDIVPPTTLLSGRDAIDNVICLGKNRGHILYSPIGYYIIDVDANGFYIALDGYCKYGIQQEQQELKILKPSANVGLYTAREIVDSCNAMFQEDIDESNRLTEQYIQSMTANVAPLTSLQSTPFLKKLELG